MRRTTVFAVLIPMAMAASVNAPRGKFTDTRLPNGLRVLLLEDHTAPVFSIAVDYNVGSRNETKGQTGYAHLIEHLMFKGSEKVSPGEHFLLVSSNGGNVNGQTTAERTIYYETLPKNQLDLALFLEADRMHGLRITAEGLENQRRTVLDERRQGLDNKAYGAAEETLLGMVYRTSGYHHPPIGTREDVAAAAVGPLRDFYHRYYTPNNAVLALVGDFDSAAALARITEYFGPLAAHPVPASPRPEPIAQQERRTVVKDALAPATRVDVAYRVAPGDSPDFAAIDAVRFLLCAGENSRAYRKLVREQSAASSVTCYAAGRRGPSLFHISAVVRTGKTPEQVEKLLDGEIAALQANLPGPGDLVAYRNSVRLRSVRSSEASLERAIRLADYALLYNAPELLHTASSRQTALTANEIVQAARRYLSSANRAVVYTIGAAAAPVKPVAARR